MTKMSFDIDGLLAAAGRYESAAAEAQTAGSSLAALSFNASALGATSSAQVLGGALHGFHANQLAVASTSTQALGAFAARLRAVGGLGVSVVDDTSIAAC